MDPGSHPLDHLDSVMGGLRYPVHLVFSDYYLYSVYPDYHHTRQLSLTVDEVRDILNNMQVPVADYFSGGGFNEPDQGLWEQRIHESLQTTICLDADDNQEDPKICVVCQDNLCQENQTIGMLNCRHEFHESCIKEWLRQKNVCPLCKAIPIRD